MDTLLVEKKEKTKKKKIKVKKSPLIIEPKKNINKFGKELTKIDNYDSSLINLNVGDTVLHETFGYSEVIDIDGKIITIKPTIKPKPDKDFVRVVYNNKFK